MDLEFAYKICFVEAFAESFELPGRRMTYYLFHAGVVELQQRLTKTAGKLKCFLKLRKNYLVKPESPQKHISTSPFINKTDLSANYRKDIRKKFRITFLIEINLHKLRQ